MGSEMCIRDRPDMERFDPVENSLAFRAALGRFATGVTIVTALGNKGPIGIAANSFSSLSLDPALILWSASKTSTRHDVFVEADAFNVHVLGANQQAICDTFTRDKYGFADLAAEPNASGVPVLAGCLAVFECRQYAIHSAGDHTLIVGEVLKFRKSDGEPLIFQNGNFRS